MLKNLAVCLAVFTGSYAFSQLSKIDEIRKESAREYAKLGKKYKKEYPPARILQEKNISESEIAEIQEAIDFIKKDEKHYDRDSFGTEVTKMPEFEGGMEGFRMIFAKTFDPASIRINSGMLRTEVTFVITENGEITDVIAQGDNLGYNQEAVIAVYRMKEKKYRWKPAEIDGKPVRYFYRLPVSMRIE